jgi:hypothetical protein
MKKRIQQMIHTRKTVDGDGIACREHRDLLRTLMGVVNIFIKSKI